MKALLKISLMLAASLLSGFIVRGQADATGTAVLKGPYLGQLNPENQSRIFASSFVSTGYGELNSVFSRDGKEFYFSRRGIPLKPSAIMVTRLMDNVWTKPGPINFSGTYNDIDVFLTADGKSLIFCSNRPHQKGDPVKMDHDFWISERKGSGWEEPVLFAEEALSEFEDFFPVVTKNGNLYFNSQRGGKGTNDIFISKRAGGKYTAAIKLPAPINTQYREFDAFVTKDENMIIFSSERPGGYGGSDIYVSFKNKEGTWCEPKNPGNVINSENSEYGAAISPDGKFFFFTSNKNGNEDIFWISAAFIEKLKP